MRSFCATLYINEVLRYQFVHRKISTLTFGTHHVYHNTFCEPLTAVTAASSVIYVHTPLISQYCTPFRFKRT